MAEAAGFRVQRQDTGLFIEGVKVVGVQQTTIANTTAVVNSNNVGDLPTKVNSILTALEAHGLLASA